MKFFELYSSLVNTTLTWALSSLQKKLAGLAEIWAQVGSGLFTTSFSLGPGLWAWSGTRSSSRKKLKSLPGFRAGYLWILSLFCESHSYRPRPLSLIHIYLRFDYGLWISGKDCSSSKTNDQIPDPSGTAGPQLQPRTLTNSIGDPDLRSYVRNDDNVPPPKIAPPVFLSAAPQVGVCSGNEALVFL